MTNSPAFNITETAAIGAAKRELELVINATEVYGFHWYDITNKNLIKSMVTDDRVNMVIAGGIVPALLNKDYGGPGVHISLKPSDIDVFILNLDIHLFQMLIQAKTGPWVTKYFFDEDNDTRPDDYKNPHVFATATNSVTNVQYILTDHKNRKELLDDFDFLHCTASYYDGKLFINRETYDCIMKKQLVRINKSRAPKQWRVEKFINRGWKSEGETMLETPSKSLNDILKDKLNKVYSPSTMLCDDMLTTQIGTKSSITIASASDYDILDGLLPTK